MHQSPTAQCFCYYIKIWRGSANNVRLLTSEAQIPCAFSTQPCRCTLGSQVGTREGRRQKQSRIIPAQRASKLRLLDFGTALAFNISTLTRRLNPENQAAVSSPSLAPLSINSQNVNEELKIVSLD